MTPMKFCMITTFYPPYNFGGDGIFVHRLSNELARHGHSVDVIHCLDTFKLLSKKKKLGPYNNHPNVKIHGLKSSFGPLSPIATQMTGLPLLKGSRITKILQQGFDVIHFHNISLVGGPGLLQHGRGVKLYTMHEYWLVCQTHLLLRFNRSLCNYRACTLCALSHGRPPQLWRHLNLIREGARHVDTFISPSRFAMHKHRELGLHRPMVHLPNFIPDPQPGSDGPGQDPYFLFVGRLEKLKGLQTLIPIFRRHPKQRLLVAGTGNGEAHLRRMADDCSNVIFLGFVPMTRLTDLYRKATAVIVPSICFEVFPTVVIEAFAHGTPVIVRRMGGMYEVIEDYGGGLLFSTEHELEDAMHRLLTDPLHRQELGLQGRQAYQRNWTPRAHLERYLKLIQDIQTYPPSITG